MSGDARGGLLVVGVTMVTLKEALRDKLSEAEVRLVPSSFDVVGDIAIFNDMPAELKKKEKLIAEVLLALQKNIKVVAKKSRKYAGRLRTPKLTILAGERRTETVHKENNAVIKLDVEKCYFSSRLATERMRIARLVKKGEDVLVSFSGVGVYPCVIAKNAQPREVYGIEINRIAHRYARENVTANRLTNVRLMQGNVKTVLPKIRKKFDRIVMPLPKSAERYLPSAVRKLKPRGTIHLYQFVEEKDFMKIVEAYKKRFSSVNLVKCGVYAPRVYRVCLDIRR